MALLKKAAGQGHAYAMSMLGSIHHVRNEHEQAVGWFTQGAEAGLPNAMFNLGKCLDDGKGVAAPDYPAAADWYRRAADGGSGEAAHNLATMYATGRGGACNMMPACHIMSASSSATFRPSFLELNGIT
jgi:TPR repeat protein